MAPMATGPELMALRSAAAEVAAAAYVDGLHKRRRHDAEVNVAIRRSDRFETIVCLLSPTLLTDLDEAVRDALLGAGEPMLEDARSVVVESALVAWLILRGYSSVVPTDMPRGWLGVVKYLVGRRRRA
jgi:hypothetical protein